MCVAWRARCVVARRAGPPVLSAERRLRLPGGYDANGNVGQIIDWLSGGRIVAYYEYDPYGGKLVATGAYAASNPFRFSTKCFEAELDYPGTTADGLYHYGERRNHDVIILEAAPSEGSYESRRFGLTLSSLPNSVSSSFLG